MQFDFYGSFSYHFKMAKLVFIKVVQEIAFGIEETKLKILKLYCFK